jgi:hypothetical protein
VSYDTNNDKMKSITSKEDLYEAIKATAIYEERHKHYKHTVAVAKKAYQYMTGEDQDEILLSYKVKESDPAKNQRLRVTNSVTQSVSNSVKAQFEELARADNVVDKYYYPTESTQNTDNLKLIESRLDVFYENDTLSKYLHEAALHLNFYDPNSFIVIETAYEKDDPLKLKQPWVYPLEVYADQAVNYHYSNGVLQWLVANHKVEYDKKDGNKTVRVEADKYTIYAPEWNIVFQEIPDEVVFEIPDGWEKQTFDNDGKRRTFVTKIYATQNPINPASRVGYIKDPATNRETCVTPLWPADKIFRDLIWTKSEYDLAKALHGFYQKFQYGLPCDYINPDTNQSCSRGRVDGNVCPECNGKGVQVHTTMQESVILKMPPTKDKIIPLSDLIHYEHIPIELIARNNEDITESESKVYKAVFQRDIINKNEVSSTATEVRVTENSKYNVISTYGAHWSKMWMHAVEVVANYMDAADELITDHEFSSDFIIETISELFDQRQKAIGAQSPYEIIRNIDQKILRKQNRSDTENVRIVEAKEDWKPFREKTEAERVAIVSTLPDGHDLKVRYYYFEEIFDQIYGEPSTVPFHEMKWEGQKERIDAIVAQIILDNQSDYDRASSFRDIMSQTTDTGE